jgi:ankyrin repeat protein
LQTLETAFHYCAHAGNNDVLVEMISHMSQTEVQKALNRQTDKGWTPLLIACYHGHMELVRLLFTIKRNKYIILSLISKD